MIRDPSVAFYDRSSLAAHPTLDGSELLICVFKYGRDIAVTTNFQSADSAKVILHTIRSNAQLLSMSKAQLWQDDVLAKNLHPAKTKCTSSQIEIHHGPTAQDLRNLLKLCLALGSESDVLK